MGFNERSYIGVLVATVLVYGWYFIEAYGLASAGETAISQFGPTMWTMVAAHIVLVIAMMVLTAILSRRKGEELEFDERDNIIEMKAERIGSYMQGCGLFAVLVLVMLEYSSFAIAHTILAVMAVSVIISFSMRLYLYRKGA
ncbi:hypothetical protein [Kordiimonas gwangyangensis]|uniref:hypothetical protein n=1 Tax=Kordiimonas gwangyangensis TaxID=288022 RepID=UPI00035EEF28|nr:hypothetical protein [Kordiimonas gwangyangensis]